MTQYVIVINKTTPKTGTTITKTKSQAANKK